MSSVDVGSGHILKGHVEGTVPALEVKEIWSLRSDVRVSNKPSSPTVTGTGGEGCRRASVCSGLVRQVHCAFRRRVCGPALGTGRGAGRSWQGRGNVPRRMGTHGDKTG